MADERYTRATMPDRDTDIDLEPPMWRIIGVRHSSHRIEQTLHFPRYFDDELVLPNVFFTR